MSNKKPIFICIGLTLAIVAASILTVLTLEKHPNWWWLIPALVVFILATLIAIFIIYFKNIEYICNHCNNHFKVAPIKSMLTLHIGRRRLLRCPHCDTVSWVRDTWG